MHNISPKEINKQNSKYSVPMPMPTVLHSKTKKQNKKNHILMRQSWRRRAGRRRRRWWW